MSEYVKLVDVLIALENAIDLPPGTRYTTLGSVANAVRGLDRVNVPESGTGDKELTHLRLLVDRLREGIKEIGKNHPETMGKCVELYGQIIDSDGKKIISQEKALEYMQVSILLASDVDVAVGLIMRTESLEGAQEAAEDLRNQLNEMTTDKKLRERRYNAFIELFNGLYGAEPTTD